MLHENFSLPPEMVATEVKMDGVAIDAIFVQDENMNLDSWGGDVRNPADILIVPEALGKTIQRDQRFEIAGEIWKSINDPVTGAGVTEVRICKDED